MMKLKTKAKKLATLPNLIILGVALLFLFTYADKLAIEETVALVLSQYTEPQEDKCIYFDGIDTCEVPENQCLADEKYAVSLGLCTNLELIDSAERAGTGWAISFATPQEFEANAGEHIKIQGVIKAQAAGKYLVEAGLEDYQELKEGGRLAIVEVPGAPTESFCDGVEYFASGEVTQVSSGDFIKFDLRPKVPSTPGTYFYKVLIGNGCYADLGEDARVFGESDLVKVIVKSGGAATTTKTTSEEQDKDAITSSVWEDIKGDFAFLDGVKGAFQAKYIMYGLIGIGVIIVIVLLISLPGKPKQGQGNHPQQQYASRQVRYT